MLHQKLTQLGLSNTEIKVYLTLFEYGEAPGRDIARRLAIARPTAYAALERLKERGMVSVAPGKSKTIFSMNTPTNLLHAIDLQEEELSQRRKIALDAIELMRPYFGKQHAAEHTVKVYEGRQAINTMLRDQSSLWQHALLADDNTWWGFQDAQFVETYRGWLNWYWSRMHANEKIQLFSNINQTERSLSGVVTNREIRPLPAEIEFSTTVWSLGGKYTVLISQRGRPHHATVIADSFLANNLKQMFKFMWTLRAGVPKS